MEISAKTREGIDELLEEILNELDSLNENKEKKRKSKEPLHLKEETGKTMKVIKDNCCKY